ncbi:hypothetical protein NDU88_003377 [Pleurodeles waltl]|uniref:Uncharacterized protein n=1 Tax=Pleurodeles waltl TaxID=8319 RepID=A0AAV7SG76_PLEWA|nr:hypothetical protein NDU88_003377 [Pleurodeles waltl]
MWVHAGQGPRRTCLPPLLLLIVPLLSFPASEQVRVRRFTVRGRRWWMVFRGGGRPRFAVKVQQAPESGLQARSPTTQQCATLSPGVLEGADHQCASLCASYPPRSCCFLSAHRHPGTQCLVCRIPGLRSILEPVSSGAAHSQRSRPRVLLPAGPPPGRAGWRDASGRGSGGSGRPPPAGISVLFV